MGKRDIIYVGRQSNTELINVTLPPNDKYCDFHKASFFSVFSIIPSQMRSVFYAWHPMAYLNRLRGVSLSCISGYLLESVSPALHWPEKCCSFSGSLSTLSMPQKPPVLPWGICAHRRWFFSSVSSSISIHLPHLSPIFFIIELDHRWRGSPRTLIQNQSNLWPFGKDPAVGDHHC